MIDPFAVQLCHCEHVEDEHSSGLLQECEVEGCSCIAYEAADDNEETSE